MLNIRLFLCILQTYKVHVCSTTQFTLSLKDAFVYMHWKSIYRLLETFILLIAGCDALKVTDPHENRNFKGDYYKVEGETCNGQDVWKKKGEERYLFYFSQWAVSKNKCPSSYITPQMACFDSLYNPLPGAACDWKLKEGNDFVDFPTPANVQCVTKRE